MSELLPCPFCGGKAHHVDSVRDHYVVCDTEDCHASTNYKHTKHEAIAAWNRRASAPPQAAGQQAEPAQQEEMTYEQALQHSAVEEMFAQPEATFDDVLRLAMQVNQSLSIIKASWNPSGLPRFRVAYAAAIRNNKDSFVFDGQNYPIKYAKHLIDHLEKHL